MSRSSKGGARPCGAVSAIDPSIRLHEAAQRLHEDLMEAITTGNSERERYLRQVVAPALLAESERIRGDLDEEQA